MSGKMNKRLYRPPSYVPLENEEPDEEAGPSGRLSSPTGRKSREERIVTTPAGQSTSEPQRWTSGICACFDDMPSCCLGMCPFILFGRNVEALTGKPSVGPCCIHFMLDCVVRVTAYSLLGGCGFYFFSFGPCYSFLHRRKLRAKYNLQEGPCSDFFTHCMCPWCAICQEYREIRERSTAANAVVMTTTEAPTQQTMTHSLVHEVASEASSSSAVISADPDSPPMPHSSGVFLAADVIPPIDHRSEPVSAALMLDEYERMVDSGASPSPRKYEDTA